MRRKKGSLSSPCKICGREVVRCFSHQGELVLDAEAEIYRISGYGAGRIFVVPVADNAVMAIHSVSCSQEKSSGGELGNGKGKGKANAKTTEIPKSAA